MALLDRLNRKEGRGPRVSEAAPKAKAPEGPSPEAAYQELKSRVHNRLFEILDLSRLSKVSEERVRQDVSLATQRILEEEKVLLTLEEAGYRVLLASTLAELRGLSGHAIDAVVLDVQLLDDEGMHRVEDVMASLRCRHPDVPILLSSGGSKQTAADALQQPKTRFLGKPYPPRALLDAVGEMVASRRQSDVVRRY